jgi:flavodoxin
MMLMAKILVVFYSRDGHTKQVADVLAKELACEKVEITESRSRKGIFGFLRSGMEAMKKKIPVINPLNINLDAIDVVLLGTPIWGGTLCSPIRAFLMQYGKAIKAYGVFCSRGGSGPAKYVSEFASVLQKEPLGSLDVVQKEFKTDAWKESLKAFIAKIS